MDISTTQETAPLSERELPQKTEKTAAIRTLSLALLTLTLITVAFEYKSTELPVEPRAAIASPAVAAEKIFADLSHSAKSAIVIDIKDNATLYAYNPDVQLPLASLVKIPLALVVSEVLSPDTIVTIPRDTAPQGSIERLAKGEKWRIQDIIDFTLVASSNAGAEILAEAADSAIRARYPDAPAGSAAVWRMNDVARELGLTHTYFLNVSGLDESTTLSGAYGSARDIATLYAYAVSSSQSSIFNETAESGIILKSSNGKGRTVAYNTNEAVRDIPGLIMGKTGITDLAGGNLAVVFDVAPAHPVVAVVLGSTREGRFKDMRELVERARQIISVKK